MLSGEDRDWEIEQDESSPFRWIVFVSAFIIASLLFIIYLLYIPLDQVFLSSIILFPMITFMLYAAYRWAQGRPIIEPTTEDEKILGPMRHHALPAEKVGLDMFRCANCGMSFESVNATLIDDKVVLCPFCDTRTYIA